MSTVNFGILTRLKTAKIVTPGPVASARTWLVLKRDFFEAFLTVLLLQTIIVFTCNEHLFSIFIRWVIYLVDLNLPLEDVRMPLVISNTLYLEAMANYRKRYFYSKIGKINAILADGPASRA